MEGGRLRSRAGKIAALRALNAAEGSPEDVEARQHPVAEAAMGEAVLHLTGWRLYYQLPPTDPRWLDATEAEILHDLLVLRYHAEHVRRMADPAADAVERTARDPEKAEELVTSGAAFLADPGTLRALRAIGTLPPEVAATPTPPRAIRIRRIP